MLQTSRALAQKTVCKYCRCLQTGVRFCVCRLLKTSEGAATSTKAIARAISKVIAKTPFKAIAKSQTNAH
jgi:hypothetical protein